MNDKNVEQFLRDSRPAVKDDPAFILETRRRLEAVEGIKEEVDRQRRHGRSAILLSLIIGLSAGILVAAVAFMFPDTAAALSQSFKETFKDIPYSWNYIILTLAVLAITLGLALPFGRKRGRA